MNAGIWGVIAVPLITAIGGAFAWWVKRASQAAQMSTDSMRIMQSRMGMIDALQQDLWDVRDWVRGVLQEWQVLQRELQAHGVITKLNPLPALPELRSTKLRAEAAAAED